MPGDAATPTKCSLTQPPPVGGLKEEVLVDRFPNITSFWRLHRPTAADNCKLGGPQGRLFHDGLAPR